MKTFIEAISQISIQEPFSENWFSQPIVPNEVYNSSIEPDYTDFFTPMEARRMGKLLKRAIATALLTLQKANCKNPDAIIVGTGLGCTEHTEKFLNAVLDNDEECLSPTSFMQSTHNTISSQIALHLKCHSYNCTYSHRATSFDNALLDAIMQMELGKINTALVGGHDEMISTYFTMLKRIGYWKIDEPITLDALHNGKTAGSISGDCALSLFLNKRKNERSLCSIDAIELLYEPNQEQIQQVLTKILHENNLKIDDIGGIVCGMSGDATNDAIYKDIIKHTYPSLPVIWYKHLFGESYCASAFGTYVAATCLNNKQIPAHLIYSNQHTEITTPKHLLVYNQFQNKDHAIILLSCCN